MVLNIFGKVAQMQKPQPDSARVSQTRRESAGLSDRQGRNAWHAIGRIYKTIKCLTVASYIRAWSAVSFGFS